MLDITKYGYPSNLGPVWVGFLIYMAAWLEMVYDIETFSIRRLWLVKLLLGSNSDFVLGGGGRS